MAQPAATTHVRLRSLPYALSADELVGRLQNAGLGWKLASPPEVRTTPSGHDGTALLQFVDAAAAAACAASAARGLRLPGFERRVFGALEAPAAPAPPPPSPEEVARAAARARARTEAKRARRFRGMEALDGTLARVAAPAGLDVAGGGGAWFERCHWALPEALRAEADASMAWDAMAAGCDPARSGAKMLAHTARGARKRAQVAEFAAVLPLLADLDGKTVVDCGCSSGNLIRPLAHRFPKTTFVGLDIKPRAVALLLERASAAGAANVDALACDIDAYDGPCDVVISLHACGGATDAALGLAVRNAAPFAVSPCCIGKIGNAGRENPSWAGKLNWFGGAGGAKSAWLTACLLGAVGGFGDYASLAAAADQSEAAPRLSVGAAGDGDAVRANLRRVRRAKTAIEVDRLVAAADASGEPVGRLLRMGGASMASYMKSDMLVSPTPALLEVVERVVEEGGS